MSNEALAARGRTAKIAADLRRTCGGDRPARRPRQRRTAPEDHPHDLPAACSIAAERRRTRSTRRRAQRTDRDADRRDRWSRSGTRSATRIHSEPVTRNSHQRRTRARRPPDPASGRRAGMMYHDAPSDEGPAASVSPAERPCNAWVARCDGPARPADPAAADELRQCVRGTCRGASSRRAEPGRSPGRGTEGTKSPAGARADERRLASWSRLTAAS